MPLAQREFALMDIEIPLGSMAPGEKMWTPKMEARIALCRRHKIFPLERVQQIENVGIEHVPRSDLLLNHIKADLFDVHFCCR